MKLSDLKQQLSSMSVEQLQQHIENIRHNKYVAKPAKAKREQDVVKKEVRKKASAVDKLIAGMSEAERLDLLKQLGLGE